jgi:acyl carrier protein
MAAMTEHEILSVLAKIIEEAAGIPASTATPEADLTNDLGISSLAMVEIVVAVEEKFSIEIPDEALVSLRAVQDVVGYVQRVQGSVAAT